MLAPYGTYLSGLVFSVVALTSQTGRLVNALWPPLLQSWPSVHSGCPCGILAHEATQIPHLTPQSCLAWLKHIITSKYSSISTLSSLFCTQYYFCPVLSRLNIVLFLFKNIKKKILSLLICTYWQWKIKWSKYFHVHSTSMRVIIYHYFIIMLDVHVCIHIWSTFCISRLSSYHCHMIIIITEVRKWPWSLTWPVRTSLWWQHWLIRLHSRVCRRCFVLVGIFPLKL